MRLVVNGWGAVAIESRNLIDSELIIPTTALLTNRDNLSVVWKKGMLLSSIMWATSWNNVPFLIFGSNFFYMCACVRFRRTVFNCTSNWHPSFLVIFVMFNPIITVAP